MKNERWKLDDLMDVVNLVTRLKLVLILQMNLSYILIIRRDVV